MHAILGARSSFSLGESILPVDKLIAAAKEAGAGAVALTDTMSVTGLIDFTNQAKKAEIKPIIACRLRFVDDVTWRKTKGVKAPPEFYLDWYVLSETGLRALFRLLSLANSDERFYTTAKLGFDDLFAELEGLTGDDVAIASGDALSVVSHPQATSILENVKGALGASNAFLTLVPIDTPYWDAINVRAIRIARELGLSCLVSRPVSYAKGKADAHEVMTAVIANEGLDSMWHKSIHERDRHPLSWEELIEATKGAIKRAYMRGEKDAPAHFKAGLSAISRLSDMAKYEWTKSEPSLPQMAPDEFAAVAAECKKGWAQRFGAEVFGHKPTPEELKATYMPRLRYELEVLRTLKFSGYFLLVQDVVQFAKGAGILVGPGRGSVGGSLVAYLMGITDCDPIRFGLLFERFINPDRIDLPDADLDFMSTRRHEVFDYLRTKYGAEKFAFVSNFMDLKSASAIRSVGKAFGLYEDDVRCSKLVPAEHGVPMKLDAAAEAVGEIADFRAKHKDIWAVAKDLEGVTRTFGQHAAGVVVSACDVVERAVVERRKEGQVVCWDKRMVEDQGLIKMDILGLTTLDLADLALRYIAERHGTAPDLMRIPLDDEKVLANFAQGLTTGVFQFESGGMRRLLRDLGADGCITFEDITAATALYRPGPMDSGMMESFWKRKQGVESIEQLHPAMADHTTDTYGVLVYQEQVMQAARTLAGYTAGGADKLRKIMGKKLPEEMNKERSKFVDGCMETVGMTGGEAGVLFDKIAAFAGYGFNKSHSVEYTLISYQSMWLKTYYPIEFFAAALSILGEDKLLGILVDAKRMGIEALLPDINLSSGRFEIVNDSQVAIPFNRIKGISENTTKAILAARNGAPDDATPLMTSIDPPRPFTSIADLSKRVDRRKCNIGHIKKLDLVGAFANVEPGQQAAGHPDRIKIQKELIPGLILEAVPIHREMNAGKATNIAILENHAEARAAHEAREGGNPDGIVCRPCVGKEARFMVITDAPTSGEEEANQFSWGRGFQYVGDALVTVGMTRSSAYWTGLLKRPKAGKMVSNEEVKAYAPVLTREIEILAPAVIVVLGSAAIRYFIPDFKGKLSEQAGRVVYSEKLDANIVIGLNPGEIFHDPSKQDLLNEVFTIVAALLPNESVLKDAA